MGLEKFGIMNCNCITESGMIKDEVVKMYYMQMQIAPEHTVVAQAQGGQTRHVPQVVGKYKINSKNKCDKIFLFFILKECLFVLSTV